MELHIAICQIMSTFSASHPIAFFCAEYGVKASLPLYAGGLGVLAGDILKQAADDQLPLVGVGLLYRGMGAKQVITPEGLQQETEYSYDPLAAGLEHVYVDDQPLFIKVHLTQVDVWLRCWQLKLGPTVTLYLLDPETDQNQVTERDIAASVYTGTDEALLKQQLLLGIGGVKLLHALNIHPALYHLNEGRPAFLHWQLIRSYMDEHGMSYEQAHQMAVTKTVYTNHTLVGGGHHTVSADLLRAYSQYYADKMHITVDELLRPGMVDGRFDLTYFALGISRKVSAVSTPHFKLCQEAWPDHDWVNITNGVHMPTWQDPDLAVVANQPALLWEEHLKNKRELAEFAQQRTGFSFNPDKLVISWARRITNYKQLDRLFTDVERLRNIMNVKNREVQLLVAGKAHAYDEASKNLIRQTIGYFQQELRDCALFIPNYDIDVAQVLTRGSDVWLNTPEFGLEACGTSGMKAAANGALACTVADGWAAEVAWSGFGWVLNPDSLSDSLYTQLESEIIPLYWQRDQSGLPTAWIQKMQQTITMSQHYSAGRMLAEYQQKLYDL